MLSERSRQSKHLYRFVAISGVSIAVEMLRLRRINMTLLLST
jgi:hypothetical protein